MAGVKRKASANADVCAVHNEWKEVLCPICMDHPHNAVLLRCTSHEKGCRSYICDTSYRHSNCFDRFKELKSDNSVYSSLDMNADTASVPINTNLDVGLVTSVPEVDAAHNINESYIVNVNQNQDRHSEDQENNIEIADYSESSFEIINLEEDTNSGSASVSKLNLSCPMCRGAVMSWEVSNEARKYLNLMQRSCSQESCSFLGNYQELRLHARKVHPTSRPANVDPSRLRAWRRLEHQREFNDVVSAVRSSMPGSVVIGDYVIDSGDRVVSDESESGPLWSTFFLFQMIGSADSPADARAQSRVLARHRQLADVLAGRRRYLWGENLLGLQNDDDDDDEQEDNEEEESNTLSDAVEDAPQIPRRRRRLTQSRSDDDQS